MSDNKQEKGQGKTWLVRFIGGVGLVLALPFKLIWLVIKSLWGLFSGLYYVGKGMVLHARSLSENRFYEEGNGPDMEDWDQVLEAWDMTQEDVDNLIEAHRRRRWLFSALIALGMTMLCLAKGSWVFLYSGGWFILVGGLYFITSCWRIHIYTSRKYAPIHEWVGFGRIF